MKKDYLQAHEYYQRAGIDFGDSVALNCLGDLYFEGKIKPQDYEKALQYYKQSVIKVVVKLSLALEIFIRKVWVLSLITPRRMNITKKHIN